MALTFNDGNNGFNEKLEFGGSIEKTFTIENTGSLDATATIYFDNLINTYTLGSLTYTLGSLTYTLEFSEVKNDAFTKTDNEKGNKKLNQKVGLITATETITCGTGEYKLRINTNYIKDLIIGLARRHIILQTMRIFFDR